jgi:hypothetical protein
MLLQARLRRYFAADCLRRHGFYALRTPKVSRGLGGRNNDQSRGYAVDEKLEHPAGKIGFRHAITLDADQQGFSGRAKFEVLDPTGAVVFSDTAQTRGVRQRAVAS